MDLSQIANIFEISFGVIAIFMWLWKLNKYFKSKLEQAKKKNEEAKEYGKKLVSKATTPESRAAIYAYINFRIVEIESINIQLDLFFWSGIILGFIVSYELLDSAFIKNYSVYQLIGQLFVLTAISTIIAFDRYKDRMRDENESWKKGIRESLEERIDNHLLKNNPS